jgi:DNA helicase HerA-like ATPase
MGTLLCIGETLGRQPHKTFGILPPDRLLHQYIIGQTGTGKSTLLLNMALQDHASRQSFCLIDPHGDLAQKLVEHIGSNCLYWDVSDPASPYGYNPLTHVTAQYRSLVASGLIDALKKQWVDAWGARMEHLLRYSLLALLERPHSTIEDIIPMFLDTTFRKQVLASVTDTYVRQFWNVEYPAMNYKTSADGVAPIANKIGAFLANPVVRKALCTPEKPLRFRSIMDEGQTLIVNLAKGKLGSDVSNVVGGLIVSSLAHAAYSRQNETEASRRPFILYIDEFHSFTTSALGDMLSELRKYGLALVLSSQHTSQIDPQVLEAILGNVGTIIAFRVGATDAPILAKQFGSDIPAPRDLVGLSNYEFFVKLMIAGQQSKPFSARSLQTPS